MNNRALNLIRANRLSLTAWALSCLLIGSLGAAEICGQAVSPTADKTPPVDRSRLEVSEELSESLANDVLTLSVAARDRDLSAIANYFPLELAAKPFPSKPATTTTKVKWIGAHNWETASGAAANTLGKITGESFLNSWSEFLNHFFGNRRRAI